MSEKKYSPIIDYPGEIHGPIIAELLDDLDFKCINLDIPEVKRKKLFNIAVEMFQNLYHYTRDLSIAGESDAELRKINLVFFTEADYYCIRTQNIIRASDKPLLQQKIDRVNSLDDAALKAYFKEILNNHSFSLKGGAGLGFIDMKKRSGRELEYNFDSISDELLKYTLCVKIKK